MKQKYKYIDIKTKRLVNNLFLGNYKAAFKGRGIEFSDFREYSPNDDAKYIDWLVSAREGKTMMRRYREERELDILFVLDLSVSMQFGFQKEKLDTLIETLYLIGFSGIQNGDKIGALLLGNNTSQFINFKKGNIGLFQILNGIESFPMKPNEASFDLSSLNALPIKNSLVFLFTDKLEIETNSLKLAAIKNDVVFIHISDSFENTLEGKQGILRLGNQEKEVVIDLDNKKKKKKYLDIRNQKRLFLDKLLSKHNISKLEIDEQTDIYQALFSFMKSREL